jgi:hypothetical protein
MNIRNQTVRASLWLLAIVTWGLASGGCVPHRGPQVTYGDTLLTLPYKGGGLRVVVAAQDRREYVISGQTKPEYVGQVRRALGDAVRLGMGIPSHRYTESGQPLASDLGRATAEALRRSGYLVAQVKIEPKDTKDIALANLRAPENARILFLVVHEWMYDYYYGVSFRYGPKNVGANYKLAYKLEARVLDSAGQLTLASVVREDDRQIMYDRAVFEYAAILADILTDPEVVSALKAH